MSFALYPRVLVPSCMSCRLTACRDHNPGRPCFSSDENPGRTSREGAAEHISSVPRAWLIRKLELSLNMERVYKTDQLHLGVLPMFFSLSTAAFWQLKLLEGDSFAEYHQACFVLKLRLSLLEGSTYFWSHSKGIIYFSQ